MQQFFSQLKRNIQGEIHNDPLHRKIYSVDASIYEVEPLGIVIPRTKEELLVTLQLAAQHNIAATARGAATGITGGCLGKGIIIDTSKYLNQILEINVSEEYAICQPGVVQDRLNEALYPLGYRLGPDTSTGNRATLGGMLANNSAGARSLFYGCMADHVEEVELALAGGELVVLNKVGLTHPKGHILHEIKRIALTYTDAIRTKFPHLPRRVSGYNLNALLDFPRINLCRLIAGSEGTLGIATQIKLRISKLPRHTGLCLICCADMLQSLKEIGSMLAHKPISLEMIDDKIIEAGRLSPSLKNQLRWIHGTPKAILVAEFEAAEPSQLRLKMETFLHEMKTHQVGYAYSPILHPEEMEQVWQVRKAGLGLLLSKRSYNRAIAFIEDISIPPIQLSEFLQEFCQYLKSKGKEAGIYGHIGSGCMHIRPYIDLRKPDELLAMRDIMQEVAKMVKSFGGAMSGEHGDGLIRSWLNPELFGKEIYQAFIELKSAFDPKNLMNPGKIVHAPPLLQDLRLNPETPIQPIHTFLDFSREGGFELAADLCNGNGECRKMENLMCPSFQATQDEYDTTRARAQSLRSIIHGKLPLKELSGDALKDILDLCLECKGCKRECPSQVDMAKMKSELLYQYQEKHGYAFRSQLFGYVHQLNKIGSPFAKIYNGIFHSPLGKRMLSWFGIAPQRDMPLLAIETFSTWFKSQPQQLQDKKLLLFNDTFTEFNEPEVGKAAFKLLTALGYEIILAEHACCGRPLISKGLLKPAQKYALKLIQDLSPFVESDLPIIILEPSCASALRDDFNALIAQSSLLSRFQKNSFTLEEFLCSHLKEGTLPLKFREIPRKIFVHTHCHQKALVGSQPTLTVLQSIPGFDVHEIKSGCCGMAGSFGYEKEHYDVSLKIAELRLFPAVRETASPNSLIIASGISCRSQIAHGTGQKAIHLSEAIALQMQS